MMLGQSAISTAFFLASYALGQGEVYVVSTNRSGQIIFEVNILRVNIFWGDNIHGLNEIWG